MKRILQWVLILILWNPQSFSQIQSDSIAELRIDSLNKEITALQRNQGYTYSQIQNLNNELKDLQDSLTVSNEKLRSLKKMMGDLNDSLDIKTSILEKKHISDLEEIRNQAARERKGMISFLIVIVLIISGVFIFFYFKDYKLEKVVEKETMKAKLEAENQIQMLDNKWKKRWKRMKFFQKRVKKSLNKNRKKK